MAYLAPIHRPSSIRHAIQLSFLSPDSVDLIVAKANRLEIYTPDAQPPFQLVLQHTKSLYGKVTLLEKIRPSSSQTDHLFVGTDRYHYFTLSWDAVHKQLKTEKAYVDVAEKAARDSQTGDRVHIDPTARFMSLECYEGVVNIIPITQAGKGKRKIADAVEVGELQDPIPVRIPEMFVRSSCFLHKRPKGGGKHHNPEIAFLWEDVIAGNKMRLKIRELEFHSTLRPAEDPQSAELEKGREAQGEVELGASHLIPLPPPIYGVLILGETSISYVDEWEYEIRPTPLDEATIFSAWCAIDTQRYALADDYGRLYLLFLHQNDAGEYNGHTLHVLGQTSRASTLVYLDGGMIFLGSHQGDSQVIKIEEQGLQILQTFANVAPILDFAVMDMGNRSSDAPVNEFSSGQARIVTGSGAYTDGSLRSVRSGVGLEPLGAIGEMGAPVSGMFRLRSSKNSGFDDTLVVSFVNSTRAFKFDSAGEVEELEAFGGSQMDECTLYAGNLDDGRVVQVTTSTVLVTDPEDSMVQGSWRPTGEARITDVATEGSTVLVSLDGAALVVLSLAGGDVQVQAQKTFGVGSQVSCITLSQSLPGAAVVGFWEGSKVATLSLQDLGELAAQSVAEEEGSLAVPRSLLVARILADQPPTLFIGLADGNVVTFSIISPQQPFAARKSIILGTQQPNFALLPRADGLENVFATCEHPSLIYGSDGRMVYSAITAEDAECVTSFSSEAFPGAIALAGGAEGEVKLAIVDEERTTHVQTLHVGETVRRIAYSAELRAFGLGTIKRTLRAGTEEVVSHFKLVDEVAFQELHTYPLNEDELVECVMRCELDDGSGSGNKAERFVVGTAYLGEQDSMRGRILVLEVTEERKLKVVTEFALKGACKCLAMCQGRIVAALVKTVVIFNLEYQTAGSPQLVKKAAYRTATAPLDLSVTGSIIAVTDLMKSLSLLEYKPGRAGLPDTLGEIARHFETVWGTAATNVSENTYLESDAEGNLIVLQHDVNGYSADDRRRLKVVSEMLLGEMVNRILPISVQPTPNALVVPRAFLATVDGSLHLFALIAPGMQDLLIRLQNAIAERVRSPGYVPFSKFRGFRSGVRDMGEEGPVRFVDGECVERFLDCGVEVQEEICKEVGMEGKSEELRGMVEGLRRIH
ncbi:DNA damage-binding protein 1 [Hortaea werneckii]|nr:DNA damage-binding protein 1 [Hortaea werneckii]